MRQRHTRIILITCFIVSLALISFFAWHAFETGDRLYLILATFLLLLQVLFLYLLLRPQKYPGSDTSYVSIANFSVQTSDAMLSADAELNITEWNKAAEKMYGYTSSEIIGRKVNTLLKTDIETKQQSRILNELQQNSFTGNEYEMKRKDGSNFFILASVSVIRDKKNRISGYVAIHKDITQRKKSERLLTEFNEALQKQVAEKTTEFKDILDRFNLIAKATNDIIWEADLLKNEAWWNDNFFEKFGHPRRKEGYTSEGWEQYLHPDDKKRVLDHVNQIINHTTHTSWIDEYRFRKADGTYLNIYDRCYIMRDKEGKAYRMIGSMTDLTDLFQARNELERSEQNLRHVLSSTAEDFYVIDKTYHVILVNEMARKSLKAAWGKPVNVGDFILDLVPSGRRDIIKENYDRVFNGDRIEYEVSNIIDGKQSWVQVKYMPVSNEKGIITGAYVVTKDTTERRKAEKSIKESEERYRTLVENAPEALVVFDVDQRKFVNVSESAVKLFKMSKEELLKIGPVELSPEYQPDGKLSAEAIIDNVGKTIQGEQPSFEWTHCDSEGNLIPCEIWLARLPSENQVLIRGSIVDITHRKVAEKALKESEEKYRTLVEQATDGIFIADKTGKFIVVNPSGYKMSQYSEEEMKKMTIYDLALAEDIQTNPFRFAEMYKEGSVRSERKMKKKDGTVIDIEINAKLLSGDRFLAFVRDITERKKAEIIIQESEAKYRAFFENSMDGILLTSPDGRVLSANPAACNMFDMSEIEITNAGRAALVDYSDPLLGVFMEERQRLGKANGELMLLRRDGSKFPAEISSAKFKDAFGQERTSMIIRDITERKKVEERLQQSEARYRSLIEQASDYIMITDDKGDFSDINSSLCNAFGYKREELLQMNISSLIDPEQAKSKPIRFDLLTSGQSMLNERRMMTKNGVTIEVEANVKMLPDGRILAIARDIHDRKRAEELIQKEKELSDRIIESLPGLFYLVDQNGQYLRWNKLKETITGYTTEEMATKTSFDFFEGGEKDMVRRSLKEGFEKGSTSLEAHLVTKTGKKILYYFTGIAIEYYGKRCLMGTAIDISDRKKAETELEASYEAVRKLTGHLQNIREEERAHIAREIHDELGQQLTVLKMDVSWLNKKIQGEDDSPVKIKLKELISMLDGTVKTVRRISSELRPSMLDDLGLVAAIEWQLTEFEKRSGIKTSFLDPQGDIELPDMVKTGLFRIFQESLTNVARHAGASKVNVVLQQKKGTFVLSIDDDGKGFDKNKIADKRTLGILGMKERTVMMGGTYDVISTPGKGTTVVVAVPLMKQD